MISSLSNCPWNILLSNCFQRMIAYHIDYNILLSVLVAQLCLTLRDPLYYSPPGFSIHGILQTRILQIGEPCPPPGDLFPNKGWNPDLLYCRWSSALQADSLSSEPPGKPNILLTEVNRKFVFYLKNYFRLFSGIPMQI